MVAHDVEDELMRVSQALVDEQVDEEARKAYEMKSLQMSLANEEMRKSVMKCTVDGEKIQDEQRLRVARMSLDREKELRERQRLQEAVSCQMVKDQQRKMMVDRQAFESKEDQRLARSELDRLDTMLTKNKEFMDGIRHKLDKYEGCQRVTEGVHNDYMQGRRRTDYWLAHKPYEDRLKAELQKERTQLQDIKEQRSSLSKALLRQIEEHHLDKNQRLFNELNEEHRLLTQELERFDVKEKQKKMVLWQQLKSMLETLQVQIRHRRQSLSEHDLMSNPEVGLNNPRDPADAKMFAPGRTVQFVPGYANQYDKLLMNAYQDKVVEDDSKNLESTIQKIDLAKENVQMKQSGVGQFHTRRKTVDTTSGIEKAQTISEYQFIRNRHKNGVFNIITNNRN